MGVPKRWAWTANRGQRALVRKSDGSVAELATTPAQAVPRPLEVDIRDFSDVTDAMASFGPAGGILHVPPGDWLYSAPPLHKHNVTVQGAGRRAARLKFTATSGNWATATAWHFGTYAPGNASRGTPKHETGYAFSPVAAGKKKIQLVTVSDAAYFSAGDLVSLEGSVVMTATLNLPNEMGVVTAVDLNGGTITLDRPLLSDYVVGAAPLTMRRLNTGSPASGSLSEAFPGVTAYVVRNARITGLTIEDGSLSGYSALDVSCFESEVVDVEFAGFGAVAGNPCARTRFSRVACSSMELAYLSHDTIVEQTQINARGLFGVWVNSGEGAKNLHFRDVNISDISSSTGSTHPSLEMAGDGCTWVGGSVVSDRPNAHAALVGGVGSRIVGASIVGGKQFGVEVGGDSCEVSECAVRGAGTKGIYIAPSSTRYLVRDNRLGRGTRTVADAIQDASVAMNGAKRGNETWWFKRRKFSAYPDELTGTTSENIIQEMTFPAQSLELGHYFEINFTGVSTGIGAQTIRIKADNTTITAISIPAAQSWSVVGRVGVAIGPIGWSYSLIATAGSAVTSSTGLFESGPDYTTVTSVRATRQLADAGDTSTVLFQDISFVCEHTANC